MIRNHQVVFDLISVQRIALVAQLLPYKDLPLGKRTEPTFPNQMLGYSQRREHCLVTSLQLLGIYFDIRKQPEKRDELIASLFETNGVYEDYKDWSSYISYEGSTLSEEIAAKPPEPT